MNSIKSDIWTHLEFFHTGDDLFDALLERIRHAKKSVRLEYYIFEYDSWTKILLEELGQARRRGCEVQLLVDGIGAYYWQEKIAEECRRNQIDLRIFMPVRGARSFSRLIVPLRFRFVLLLRLLNRRNHRKVALIDDEWAFLGSMNMTQVHSERRLGKRAWRDTGVLIKGAAISDVVRAYHLSWARSRRRFFRRFFWRRDRQYNPATSPFRLNTSRHDRRYLNRDLLKRLRLSKHRVLIETAYFLPQRPYLHEFVRAARRGVRVEIIMPGPSDVPLVQWAARPVLAKLIQAGVKLYEYQPRVLHAKFQIIDAWACVGSLNFNHRSFIHDLEADLSLTEPAPVNALADQWEKDRLECRQVETADIEKRRLWQRIVSWLAYRFLRAFL